MAERSDIVVDWPLSPRIITVQAPSTEITQQDLLDTLRKLESQLTALDDDPLTDAAGKENLGGGVLVGISQTLQNAQLAFEARTTPTEEGTATSVGTIILTDTAAQFVTVGVQRGALIVNFTDKAVAEVLSVENQTHLTHRPLTGGSGNDWGIGDAYRIYNIVQCDVTGGNLVALDEAGDPMSPIFPAAFTQVVKTSSSSATLQELGAIQYSSYNGGVTVDTSSPYSGIVFPVGTPQQPVNNMTDAMLIAVARGLTTIFVVGDLTLDAGGDYSEMVFIGESIGKTAIDISPAAQVENCEFYEATIAGTLDGNAKVKNCQILDLNYINGVVELCMLGPGEIVLGGADEANFLDCWSGGANVVGRPVINCGGSGQSLSMRNYSGGVIIRNKTGAADRIVIDMASGEVVLESTVTAGLVTVRGVGVIDDQSVGATVDSANLLNKATISKAVLDEPLPGHLIPGTVGEVMRTAAYAGAVYVDTLGGGVPGTSFPRGTPTMPVDNLADARTIADGVMLREFRIRGSVTLDQDYTGYAFFGQGDIKTDVLSLAGRSVDKSYFNRLMLQGVATGNINAQLCILTGVSGIGGVLVDSGLQGTTTLGGPGCQLICKSLSFITAPAYVDMVGPGRVFVAQGSGDVTFKNAMSGAPFPTQIQIGLTHGLVTFDVSCTGGAALVRGVMTLVNNGAITVTDWALYLDHISDHVDTKLTGTHGSGSWVDTGAPPSPETIADAVVAKDVGGQTVGTLLSQIPGIGANVELIKEVESGKWEIINNQMIFYSPAGVEILRFNLFGPTGNPSMTDVYKRVPV